MPRNGKRKNRIDRYGVGRHCVAMIFILMSVFSGCAILGPDDIKPSVELPEHWNNAGQEDPKQDIRYLAVWWQTLDDPLLTTLIHQAATNNLDVKQAFSRVKAARFQRLKTRASLFPTLDMAAAFRKNFSEDESGNDVTSELYTTGLDAGWELDLFGGTRRSVAAAGADLKADIENLNDVMVTLLAETALNYIDVRTYQARLAVAENNVKAQKETWELLNTLTREGLGDELAVAQARYNLESTRTRIPDLKTGLEAAMNRLAVLTGQPPGALHDELSEVRPIPEVSPGISNDLAVGVPVDMIRRRPDIRKAEQAVYAQTARIGVAEADRFPKLTLDGNIGFSSLSADQLFSTGSRTLSFGPSLSLPIFRAGAIKNNIKVQEELRTQTLIQYKAVVLSALEEVENALKVYAGEQQKIERLEDATRAARSAAELAGHQYATGMIDFNSVLDAQRSLLSFEDQLAQSRGKILSDLVCLYKALGGGWQSFDKVKETHTSTVINPAIKYINHSHASKDVNPGMAGRCRVKPGMTR